MHAGKQVQGMGACGKVLQHWQMLHERAAKPDGRRLPKDDNHALDEHLWHVCLSSVAISTKAQGHTLVAEQIIGQPVSLHDCQGPRSCLVLQQNA